jgi:hypothetical protein
VDNTVESTRSAKKMVGLRISLAGRRGRRTASLLEPSTENLSAIIAAVVRSPSLMA